MKIFAGSDYYIKRLTERGYSVEIGIKTTENGSQRFIRILTPSGYEKNIVYFSLEDSLKKELKRLC